MAEINKNKDNDLKPAIDDNEENVPSECQACGGQLKFEKVNLEDYQGGKLYMMEGVSAYVCQNCGENWIPEPILEEFENMIQATKQRAKEKKAVKTAKKKGEKK